MNALLRLTQVTTVVVGAIGALSVLCRPLEEEAREDGERASMATEPAAESPAAELDECSERRLVIPAVLTVEPAWAQAALAGLVEIAALDELPVELGPFPALDSQGGAPRSFDAEPRDWLAGRRTFEREWSAAEGLGAPEFNAKSCAACHHDPVLGGAGGNEFNVTRVSHRAQDRYRPGGSRRSSLAQAQVHQDERKSPRASAQPDDGEPARTTSARSAGTSLQTPSILGLGLIDSIPAQEILRRADPEDSDGDGVRGVASWVTLPTKRGDMSCRGPELGRFGWKAEVPRLADFVCLALGGETGITIPDQGRGFGLGSDADEARDPELDQAGLYDLVLYMKNLAPPARKGGSQSVAVQTGRQLFELIGCAACHVPALRGAGGRPVELYSDLLLHEVLGLSDAEQREEQSQGEPAGVRTPPLWGVSETAPYLHDGRAATLSEAVLAHDLEAAPARERFAGLLEFDQRALLAFLEDL